MEELKIVINELQSLIKILKTKISNTETITMTKSTSTQRLLTKMKCQPIKKIKQHQEKEEKNKNKNQHKKNPTEMKKDLKNLENMETNIGSSTAIQSTKMKYKTNILFFETAANYEEIQKFIAESNPTIICL